MVTKEISYDKLQERLVAAGQQHVLKFYAELPQEEKASLLQQLSQIPIDNLREYFEEATQASPLKQTKLIPLDKKSVFVRDSDEALRKEWDGLGFKAIKEDKVAVVTLAGGQGTRLGSARPKGCFNIGLPSQKSLFQLQAERVQRLKVLTGTQVLWYIMTSAPTHRDTVDFFESNNFFGLDSSKIRFFQQGFLPAFDMEGKVMLQTKGSMALAPDGNGGIYSAMGREGVIQDLIKHGVEVVHMHAVDNCLVRMADPAFIGMFIKRGADVASKSVPKIDPKESVGVLCRRESDQRLVVAEYSELDPTLTDAADAEGNLLFNEANIANHLFTTTFLQKICLNPDFRLHFHVAKKKIPSIDLETGQAKNPPPYGIKLEAFIFDALEFSKSPVVFQVSRSSEFAPLKNASRSSPEDTPEACSNRLSELHKSWLAAAGAILQGDGLCEISPLLSYGGEGLDRYVGVTIQLPKHLE